MCVDVDRDVADVVVIDAGVCVDVDVVDDGGVADLVVDCVVVGVVVGCAADMCVGCVVDGVDGDADVDVGGVDDDLCGGGDVVGRACAVDVVAVVVGVGCAVVCFVCADR